MVLPELKERRLKKGWSQRTLADKVGCTEKTIGKAEKGRGVNLSFAKAIERALKEDSND